MSQNRGLNSQNLLERDSLRKRVARLNEIIKPGFNFGEITKKDNPKEYFVASALNKMYSLNVSMENMLLTNDIFLCVFLYRYIYELYIKSCYIFSGSTDEEIVIRINSFFDNKDLKLTEYLDKSSDNFFPPNFKEDHPKKYKMMSRITHPNIDSFGLHLDKTSDVQFDFLVPNVNLTIWHTVEIVRCFSNARILDLDRKINQNDLKSL